MGSSSQASSRRLIHLWAALEAISDLAYDVPLILQNAASPNTRNVRH